MRNEIIIICISVFLLVFVWIYRGCTVESRASAKIEEYYQNSQDTIDSLEAELSRSNEYAKELERDRNKLRTENNRLGNTITELRINQREFEKYKRWFDGFVIEGAERIGSIEETIKQLDKIFSEIQDNNDINND